MLQNCSYRGANFVHPYWMDSCSPYNRGFLGFWWKFSSFFKYSTTIKVSYILLRNAEFSKWIGATLKTIVIVILILERDEEKHCLTLKLI